MKQLKIYDNIITDANIIIYYCFNTEETRIVELTDKTHKLIEFLISNDITIRTPKFIINEINRVDFSKKIDEMILKRELTNMPKDSGYYLKMKIELKVKHKLNQLQKKDWFIVEDYFPSDESIDKIRDFFEGLIQHPKINEFLNIKKRNSIPPSFEDMGLLSFSKNMNYPILTNDYDLSFFRKELLEEKLSADIFHMTELDIYNN